MEFKLKSELMSQLETIAKREKTSIDLLLDRAVKNFIEEDNLTKNSVATNSFVNTVKRNNFIVDYFKNNKNTITIHTKFILSPHELFWTSVAPPNEKEMNSELFDLISKILMIPGIKEIQSIDKYSISVVKGKAFDWNDILPHIEQKLIDYQK